MNGYARAMPWQPDPNDPLQESPKAVFGRLLTIGLPFAFFVVVMIWALVAG